MAGRSGTELVEVDAVAPRGGRPRDETRHDAILAAALGLIAEVGYEATTMEAVAARAGVSKATIYRRWANKAELVAEAIRRDHGKDTDPVDTGSIRDDLLALVRSGLARLEGVDGGLICGLAVAVRSDSELGRLLDQHQKEHRDRATTLILDRAVERGEIPATTEPPDFLEAAWGVSILRLLSGQPLDSDFAEYLVDKVLLRLVT